MHAINDDERVEVWFHSFFIRVIFIDDVSCLAYMASAIGESMSTEH